MLASKYQQIGVLVKKHIGATLASVTVDKSPRRCELFVLQSLPKVPWYKERNLTNITLGGLVLIVVIQTLQVNISSLRVSVPVLIKCACIDQVCLY